MLTGYYENSIDAKGRLIVPQSFREQLGEEFVINRSDTKCIRIYSREEYDKLYTNIAKAKAEHKLNCPDGYICPTDPDFMPDLE